MTRVKGPGTPAPKAPGTPTFNLVRFLDSQDVSRRIIKYDRRALIFSQGEAANAVFYIQQGTVKLSVMSRVGKEAVVAMLGPGDFLGEGCLAAQPRRISTASAMTASTLLRVEKRHMIELLHTQPELAERFLTHMLARNVRIEEDLVDQLFNSSEKRLARTLLLLARYGKEDRPQRVLPKLSQATLAEMIGSTRTRVNFFMNKFRDLGFIEYNGGLKINTSLLSVVLHD